MEKVKNDFFIKTRPARYTHELENELLRLTIVRKYFKRVKVPERFYKKGSRLYTMRVGYKTSDYFKYKMSPEKIIDEYSDLLSALWKEKIECKKDLTPEWVKMPRIDKKISMLHPDFRKRTRAELMKILKNKPAFNNDVIGPVHGDLCPVNIVFNRKGKAVGLIDLGDFHIGDRRLDIAVLSWTIRGNFGKKYEKLFLKKFNFDVNDNIIEYYRLIYDLSLPAYKNWNWIKE